MKALILISGSILGLLLLVGCAESSDLSPADDAAVRENMTRPLTEEEIAKASGGGAKPNEVPEGAVAPPPKGQ